MFLFASPLADICSLEAFIHQFKMHVAHDAHHRNNFQKLFPFVFDLFKQISLLLCYSTECIGVYHRQYAVKAFRNTLSEWHSSARPPNIVFVTYMWIFVSLTGTNEHTETECKHFSIFPQV